MQFRNIIAVYFTSISLLNCRFIIRETDGLVSGAYNKETREFEIVDQGTYQRSINTAIRMANAKAPQNTLLLLPIAAPSQGSVQ